MIWCYCATHRMLSAQSTCVRCIHDSFIQKWTNKNLIKLNLYILLEKGTTKPSSGTYINILICSVEKIVDNQQEYVYNTRYDKMNVSAMACLVIPLGKLSKNKSNRMEWATAGFVPVLPECSFKVGQFVLHGRESDRASWVGKGWCILRLAFWHPKSFSPFLVAIPVRPCLKMTCCLMDSSRFEKPAHQARLTSWFLRHPRPKKQRASCLSLRTQ